jgi:GT2 family glycosyltransferase
MSDPRSFSPARIIEIELAAPLPNILPAHALTGEKYRRAQALVRLHTQPLGLVELELGENGQQAEVYAAEIWRSLSQAINEHLQEDGLPQAQTLPAAGLVSSVQPRCVLERAALLETAPFVSIIVATHDRPSELAAALQSLLALAYTRYEIIVVDNAPSTNATAELIQSLATSRIDVRYVREDCAGLAIAHNRGLLEVTAPIVAFTDDDVRADPHWLTEIVRGFRISDQVACVTGLVLPSELETQAQAWFEQFGGFTKGFTLRVFDRSNQSGPLYPYTAGRFGSGASMAFRTAMLCRLGGFDSALGAGTLALGGDDLAAFFQIVMSGYQLVYQPAALLYHCHRREYAKLRRQINGYGVGLTAYLTKALLDKPGRLFDFATRIPAGLAYTLGPRSPKNQKRQADYPADLTRLERRGMLYGPLAYLRSRWRTRHLRYQFELATFEDRHAALRDPLTETR